jgi:hypothetical protein
MFFRRSTSLYARVRGDSILKWQKAPEPIQTRFPELLHRNEGVGPAQRGAHDQDDNFSEWECLSIARIAGLLETVGKRSGLGSRGSSWHRQRNSWKSDRKAPKT